MSSTYRCAVRVPGMATNGVLLSNEMAPQTITPYCGPVWCSTVRPGSKRCPGRLQTRLRRSSGHKTLDLLKFPFGDENVNKPTTFRWFSRFKNGMESVKDEKRVGRPILHRNPEKEAKFNIFDLFFPSLFIEDKKQPKQLGTYATCMEKGVIGERAAQKWFEKFKNGDLDLEETLRSGRPSEFDEEYLKALLKEDGRQTTRLMLHKSSKPPFKSSNVKFYSPAVFSGPCTNRLPTFPLHVKPYEKHYLRL
ncbi:hypothetical protein LAZ67_X004146 [Cordylochernes scorpioides]|uniref:Mos1 transposase HTH domain-containing protein n=1 Tax=Cordylochernes scorpioides TaxID=51811 RepID=A0ABY6LX86_9ARAC|nr:hypothetical protein LAZ67_X004146 [Cordylochernes scorpioides]